MMLQTSVCGRIAATENFVAKLKTKRDAIVNVLMWEICKVCVCVCVSVCAREVWLGCICVVYRRASQKKHILLGQHVEQTQKIANEIAIFLVRAGYLRVRWLGRCGGLCVGCHQFAGRLGTLASNF
jgi:hypothetical protein